MIFIVALVAKIGVCRKQCVELPVHSSSGGQVICTSSTLVVDAQVFNEIEKFVIKVIKQINHIDVHKRTKLQSWRFLDHLYLLESQNDPSTLCLPCLS